MRTYSPEVSLKYDWTHSSLQLLQAAHFALNFNDFCGRILMRTFSHFGFDTCLLAKVEEHNSAHCVGYYYLADRIEHDRRSNGEKDNNLLELNLDNELLLKIASGEPHWQSQPASLISPKVATVFGFSASKIELIVPLPVFCGEVGFLLLSSNKDALIREVESSEIDFLQWVLATYVSITKCAAESESVQSSFLDVFTIRQRKIYDHLISGLTNSQIARILNVSVSTVKAEIGVIYLRLGVHKRSELRDKHEF